jgi:hypothetical protein
VSVNVTTDESEVITTRLKKLLKVTRICGVTRLEGAEMKIYLFKEFLTGLNKLLTTKLGRRNSMDQ